MRISASVAILILFVVGFTSAQTSPPPGDPQFEVASIKPNNSGSTRSSSSMPPTGFYRAVNVSLRQLIIDAFRVRPFQITGGPNWLDNDKFDVQARTGVDALPDQMPAMLRALLSERFGLVTHNEMRDESVYLLTRLRDAQGLGPSIRLSECTGNACGMNTSISNGAGTLRGTGRTMDELAQWVSNMVDRVVLDRTGMPGIYDFDLTFTRDVPAANVLQDAPTIFTAVREQLGLRLESGRGPVDFVVIDKVARPTPD